ncbi:MAG TPA: hypothetical protein VNC61_11890 [Acidimicrobiales bacterium]|nr:hypothetical protein [Acidimicrobiales bacterium]
MLVTAEEPDGAVSFATVEDRGSAFSTVAVAVAVAVGPTLTAFAENWGPETATLAFTARDEGDMMRYGLLEAHETATAIIDAVPDTNGPDDILIAADPQS